MGFQLKNQQIWCALCGRKNFGKNWVHGAVLLIYNFKNRRCDSVPRLSRLVSAARVAFLTKTQPPIFWDTTDGTLPDIL